MRHIDRLIHKHSQYSLHHFEIENQFNCHKIETNIQGRGSILDQLFNTHTSRTLV